MNYKVENYKPWKEEELHHLFQSLPDGVTATLNPAWQVTDVNYLSQLSTRTSQWGHYENVNVWTRLITIKICLNVNNYSPT